MEARKTRKKERGKERRLRGRGGKEKKEKKRLDFRVTNFPACLGLTNFSLRDFQCSNPETLKKAKTIWPH